MSYGSGKMFQNVENVLQGLTRPYLKQLRTAKAEYVDYDKAVAIFGIKAESANCVWRNCLSLRYGWMHRKNLGIF